MTPHCLAFLVASALGALLAGCGDGEPPTRPLPSAPERLEVVPGVSFTDPGEMPFEMTCDGADPEHPALAIRKIPPQAQSLAFLIEDIDAERYVHWSAWDLPPDIHQFEYDEPLPVHEGETTGGETDYEPPCPPEGGPAHDYRILVYALGVSSLGLEDGAAPDAVYEAIDREAIAGGELDLHYFRPEDKPFG